MGSGLAEWDEHQLAAVLWRVIHNPLAPTLLGTCRGPMTTRKLPALAPR